MDADQICVKLIFCIELYQNYICFRSNPKNLHVVICDTCCKRIEINTFKPKLYNNDQSKWLLLPQTANITLKKSQ